MRKLWLCGIAVLVACDAGRAPDTAREAVATNTDLRDKFESAERPTCALVARELASWYPSPQLHTVEPEEDRGMIRWKRFYDGVEMGTEAISSRLTGPWSTSFKPELLSPERPRRSELIGEAKAKQAAHLAGTMKAKLIYNPVWVQRNVSGTNSSNAADIILVIGSWRLVYRVEGAYNGVNIDAYSGEIVDRWSTGVP